MAFGAANMSICHKFSINLDSVGSDLKSLYSRAGTLLRYLPWMTVYARGLSANMEGRSLSANMEDSVQSGY